MKLGHLAHSRAGDKGDISTFSLIPCDEKDFDLLVKEVTVQKVKDHLSGNVKGEITRYEMANFSSLLFC